MKKLIFRAVIATTFIMVNIVSCYEGGDSSSVSYESEIGTELMYRVTPGRISEKETKGETGLYMSVDGDTGTYCSSGGGAVRVYEFGGEKKIRRISVYSAGGSLNINGKSYETVGGKWEDFYVEIDADRIEVSGEAETGEIEFWEKGDYGNG